MPWPDNAPLDRNVVSQDDLPPDLKSSETRKAPKTTLSQSIFDPLETKTDFIVRVGKDRIVVTKDGKIYKSEIYNSHVFNNEKKRAYSYELVKEKKNSPNS